MITAYFGVVLLTMLLIVLLSIVYYTIRCGISPMPSSAKAVRILSGLIAEISPPSHIIETGSGFGGLAIALARTFPGVRITAYELSPVPFIFSKILIRLLGIGNLHVFRADYLREDLSAADIIVCYLYPGGMARLMEKLKNELSRNAVVLSNTFAMPGWNPEKVIDTGDIYRTKVYVYRMAEVSNNTLCPDAATG